MVTLVKYNGTEVENYVQYENVEDVPAALLDEFNIIDDETEAEQIVDEFNIQQAKAARIASMQPTEQERLDAIEEMLLALAGGDE